MKKVEKRKQKPEKGWKEEERTWKTLISMGGCDFCIGAACRRRSFRFSFFNKERGWKKPPELLTEYMAYVLDGEYEKMYGILDAETSGNVSLEDFIERNEAIYKGIEIRSLGISAVEYDEERMAVKYHSSCETAAGNISFDNEACFIKGEEGYWLSWNDGLIFPGLEKRG